MRNLRTPIDLPLALFVISALIGVWASYDPQTSWGKFWLIVLAVVIYYLVVWSPARLLDAIVWVWLIASAAFALYFVTQHDYANAPGKFEPITQLGLYLSQLSPQLNWHQPNPNIASGVFEVALPVNLALLFEISARPGVSAVVRRARDFSPGTRVRDSFQVSDSPRHSLGRFQISKFLAFLVSLSTCLLVSLGLIMTGSRGAWGALALVGCAGVVIALGNRVRAHYAIPGRVWVPLGIIALSVVVVALFRFGDVNWLSNWLGAIPVGASAVSRAELFDQTWHLIQDYYFTGAGLGVFPMVFSTYALLINVPFLTHAHNLFLEIWIEQGLVGFVAFAWVVLEFYLWVGRGRTEDKGLRTEWLVWGGVAAVTVMLLHGLVDVLLYSSRALPLMLLPMGLAVAGGKWRVASGRWQVASPELQLASRKSQGSSLKLLAVPRGFLAVTVGFVAVIGLLLALSWNQLAAMWYANLGSVEQTKVELSSYTFPDHLVEYTRRQCQITNAKCQIGKQEFQKALTLDKGNVTANQRLAELALSFDYTAGGPAEPQGRVPGQDGYEAARGYAEAAYARDPGNGVNWQLLGDAYLGLGRMDESFALWSRVPGGEAKLREDAWEWYERNGDKERAARARTLAERIKSGRE